jgi:hypothetical protein
MKRSTLYFIIIIFFVSCSKDAEDILVQVKKCYNNGDYDKVMECYTDGTIRAIDELEKITDHPELKRLNIGKKFMEGTSWEVVKDDVRGDTALLTIKYTEHPVENMRGLNITFRLKQEGRKWKIDEEKEVRDNIAVIRKSGKNPGKKS